MAALKLHSHRYRERAIFIKADIAELEIGEFLGQLERSGE